ncbi:MAG: glutamine--fructose-6-phosphate transaminase (isomerizing), partial [Lachnospiraceae bacterium]|nr:glutamine--fructose-6-phosphate transaminase (isomerizing) [Lachnospiraceae bacterium]
MCGIVGFVGKKKQAAPIILDGLSKLEYRGYDSAGMAVYDGNSINVVKAAGRLEILFELTHGGETAKGLTGIGHTRWATHGQPTDVNAHPHLNGKGTIAVVHNGIIENYMALRKMLTSRGYEFKSETDTEVIPHLLDLYYRGDPLEAIQKVLHRVEGSYSLGIIFADHPNELFAARKSSPLICARTEDGAYIASDVPALLKYTRRVYYIGEEEIVRMSADSIEFFDVDALPVEKEEVEIKWDAEAAEKGGYEFFMIKEIYEEPKTVRDTISPRIKDGQVVIEELGLSDEEIAAISRIHIVACGSAYHAGVTGKYVFEGMARIGVDVDIASEFRYRDPIIGENDLVIVISQSGETADTLEALRV